MDGHEKDTAVNDELLLSNLETFTKCNRSVHSSYSKCLMFSVFVYS